LAGRATRAGKALLRSAPKLLLFLKPIAAAEHVVTFFNAVCARVRHDKPTGSVSNLLATAALIIALLGLLMVLMCVRGNGGVRQAAVNRVRTSRSLFNAVATQSVVVVCSDNNSRQKQTRALQQFCRYSITRSVWPSSGSGMAGLSAFAAFKGISIDKNFKLMRCNK
jgi:hypothetical protein